MQGKMMKEVLLYLMMPEDTTEARVERGNPALAMRRKWLGPCKAAVWIFAAVAGPLLLCALFA